MKLQTPRRWIGIAALILCAASTPATANDPKLLAAARAAEPAVIESLREMVAIESGSQDAAGLKAMADYIEARLRALGAATERFKAGPGPGEMVKGTFTGTGKRNIMLIAHMDTVYPKGILATEPFRQDGNKLHGPGIADDKGGIAVILHSLAILRDAGWKDYARLTVLINPDEEIGSNGSGETIATLATAGSVRNQIPDQAEAGSDVRLLAPDAADKLLAALRGKVAESRRVPETETTVSLLIGRPPYVAGAKGKALATKAQAIYAELDGRKLILHPSSGGGTDAGYAGRSGKPAVLESLVLAGWGYHAKNEYIEIDSIVPRLYLTTRLLSDLARE